MKAKRFPEIVRTDKTEVTDMTLDIVSTRSLTFTLEQLRYLVTADKWMQIPITREQANDLLKSVIRSNRWELFGSYVTPYRIIFNGYGQFKSVENDELNISAAHVFKILINLRDK